jgi:hypothetical protein
VRIGLEGGQRQTGEVVRLEPDSLWLQTGSGPALNLLLRDVQRLEVRQQSVEDGAVVGFGVGGLAGGLFLAIRCQEDRDNRQTSVGGCASLGSLLGGLVGAGAGALVGLLVPQWSKRYERGNQGPPSLLLGEAPQPVPVPRTPEKPRPRFTGEVGAALALAQERGSAQSNQGLGGRLHLLAFLGPHVAIGPEAAWYSHIGSRTDVSVSPGQDSHVQRSLFHLGGLLRVGREFGEARVSLLGGLAFARSLSNHASASVGGEAELPLWGEALPPVALDVRYHMNLGEAPAHPDPNVLSIGLGTRLRW